MSQTSREQATAKWLRRYHKLLKEKEDTFNKWLGKIAKVPQPLKTLTQEEWVAACTHFGECAICHNESIDARGMFVAFGLGGRYAAWNVIPICDECATALRYQQNPFIKYEDAVPGIIEYLQPILERTVKNEKNI